MSVARNPIPKTNYSSLLWSHQFLHDHVSRWAVLSNAKSLLIGQGWRWRWCTIFHSFSNFFFLLFTLHIFQHFGDSFCPRQRRWRIIYYDCVELGFEIENLVLTPTEYCSAAVNLKNCSRSRKVGINQMNFSQTSQRYYYFIYTWVIFCCIYSDREITCWKKGETFRRS